MSISFAVIRVSTEMSPYRSVIFADMLFKPVLAWMIDGLKSAGIQQFYLVGRDADKDRAMGCVPPDTQAVFCQDEDELPEESGNALVLTRPVILTGKEIDATVRYSSSYGIPAVSLVDEEKASLGAFYLDLTNPEWVRSRLQDGDSFSQVLEQEGIGLSQFMDNGDAIVVDDYRKLQEIGEILRKTIVEAHMEKGVNFLAPDSAMIGPEVLIGAGTVVYPQVILRGKVQIGTDCKIGPGAMITASKIGDSTEVNASQLTDCQVGMRCKIGPFISLSSGEIVPDDTSR